MFSFTITENDFKTSSVLIELTPSIYRRYPLLQHRPQISLSTMRQAQEVFLTIKNHSIDSYSPPWKAGKILYQANFTKYIVHYLLGKSP